MSIHLANQSLDFKNWPNIQRQAKKGHVESMYLYGIAHILGGYVEQNNYETLFGAAFDNVVNFIKGTPTNIVNPGALQVRR